MNINLTLEKKYTNRKYLYASPLDELQKKIIKATRFQKRANKKIN